MKSFKDYLLEEEQANETPSVGDIFEFEIARDETLIETTIVDVLEDGVVLNADATAWSIFESAGYFVESYDNKAGRNGGHLSAMGSNKPKQHIALNHEQANNNKDTTVQTEGTPVGFHSLRDRDTPRLGKNPNYRAGDLNYMGPGTTGRQDKKLKTKVYFPLMLTPQNPYLSSVLKGDKDALEKEAEDLGMEQNENGIWYYPMYDLSGKTKGEVTRAKYIGGSSIMGHAANDFMPSDEEMKRKKLFVEGFLPNSFEGENEDFGLGTLRYKAVVDDDGRVQVIHDSITVETGGPNSPEEFRELSAEDQIYALEAAQEDAEEVWSERDDKYAHYIDEGKVKDLLMDVQELSDKEFQEKYNMSKAEAKEKFNLDEAEYRGRKVPLGKPMRGDVKKFKVYVKDPKTGNVKKVNFGHGGTSAKRAGQKTMSIKKSNPARRKSFRARHNCSNPGPRTKARYWSCRAW